MKTVLYYFTGTGNSLALARGLADRLEDAEVASITAAPPEGEIAPDAEAVGFVVPVYVGGIPLIADRFAGRVRPKEGAYLFAVVNPASFAFSAANLLDEALRRGAGRGLSASWCVKMPGNYTPLYGAESEAKQRRKFDRAGEALDRIAVAVQERDTAPSARLVPPFSLAATLLWRLGAPRFRRADRRFFVTGACTSCGRCARVCPVQNITMAGGRPVWHGHCEQCMACLQWCPTSAIEAGKITQGRERYRHPDVTAEEMVAAAGHTEENGERDGNGAD